MSDCGGCHGFLRKLYGVVEGTLGQEISKIAYDVAKNKFGVRRVSEDFFSVALLVELKTMIKRESLLFCLLQLDFFVPVMPKNSSSFFFVRLRVYLLCCSDVSNKLKCRVS